MQLSVTDVAAHLDVSEDTVYGWIRAGELPFTRLHEQYRLNSVDLLEWAVRRGHRLSLDLLQKAQGDAALAQLPQALEAGGLHRVDRKPTRAELTDLLVTESRAVDEADRAVLRDLLLASESLAPTGLGGGIAIPHVRTPVVVHGASSSCALWYLKEPVDYFQSPDRVPVDTIFFLVTPTPRAHLTLVSQLMMALHDEAFRKALKERAALQPLLEVVRRLPATKRPGVGSQP